MRALQEFVQNPELIHQLQRGRMNGVATEIAQEIGMLLKHHDFHAEAGQQKAQHHAGGPSANDATSGLQSGCHGAGRLCRHYYIDGGVEAPCITSLRQGLSFLSDMSGGHLPPAPLVLYTKILPPDADITEAGENFP